MVSTEKGNYTSWLSGTERNQIDGHHQNFNRKLFFQKQKREEKGEQAGFCLLIECLTSL